MSSPDFTALGSSLPPFRFRIHSSETGFTSLAEGLSILIRQMFVFDSYGGSIPDTRYLITIVYPSPPEFPILGIPAK